MDGLGCYFLFFLLHQYVSLIGIFKRKGGAYGIDYTELSHVTKGPAVEEIHPFKVVFSREKGHGGHGMGIHWTCFVHVDHSGDTPEPHAERGGIERAILSTYQ